MTSEIEALLHQNWVGPVIQAGEFADAVVEALKTDNPGREIRLFHRGSYVRILSERRLKLRRESLERELGRPVRFPGEVEVNLSAFAGRIRTSSDEIEWYYESL
jgi:toluene monooxygenase system protein D